MNRISRVAARAHRWGVRATEMKERVLRKLMPSRMHFVHYQWPLMPEVCPCDIHFCDYLAERSIRQRAIFHFGSGGHHLVGFRNRQQGLANEVLAITASPREHARYVKEVIRDPSLGEHYKVLFADIYNLRPASLPVFDVITLFHLCEFGDPGNRSRRLDDQGVLDLFLSRAVPGGKLLFYADSSGKRETQSLIERAVTGGRIRFEEQYRSLLVYRITPG
jgi:hypothetical protein